jgi:mannose-6-phosphate isomerase-like protein (cupin superfamily)
MKKLISGFAAGLAIGLAVATAAFMSSPLTASAAGISPQARGTSASTVKIVLDNDRVRVRDVTFPPGVTGMHTHELPHVGIVIQGGTLVFRYPDGKSETMNLEVGGVGFREAHVTHEPVNPGSSPVRVIEVEVK